MGRALMIGLLACAATPALAADLPSLALDPPPSPWHGLSLGTSVVAVGGRGAKGFVGGDVTADYDRVLASGIILGVGGAAGVAPGFSGFGPVRGYDFATLGAKIAYPLGRWTPSLTTGLVLARPDSRLGSGFKALDAASSLFNGPEKLDAGGRVGAGVDYALTRDTSIGLGVSVHQGPASVFP